MQQLLNKLLEAKPRLYVATTGAAPDLQANLWSIPGCSKFFVGASFPYSREAMEEFLGFMPEKAVSVKTAIQMAQEAFMRACRGPGNGTPMGLGLTCAVSTDRTRKGDDQAIGVLVTEHGSYLLEMFFEQGERRDFQNMLCTDVGMDLLEHHFDLWRRDDVEIINEGLLVSTIMEQPMFRTNGARANAFHWGLDSDGHVEYIYPGSWNPLHDGHRQIAHTARNPSRGNLLYTLTINSVHKPALRSGEILKRASQFRYEKFPLLICQDDALFVQKAQNFPGRTFVIGADTMQRLLDPKWSDPGEVRAPADEQFWLLYQFQKNDVSFVVTDRGSLNADMLWDSLPTSVTNRYLRTMFKRIHFSSPISSTEIRERNSP